MEAKIRNSTLTLTANQRLANYLIQQHDQLVLQKQPSTVTATIVPLRTWYRQQLEAQPVQKKLLSHSQQHYLWRQIIEDNFQHSLKSSETFIDKIIAAWELIQYWQVDVSDIIVDNNVDVINFVQWATLYTEFCQQHGWTDNASTPKLILGRLKQQLIPLPKKIMLAGFDEITPIDQLIFTELKQQSQVDVIELNNQTAESMSVALSDYLAELRHMATWGKQQIHNNKTVACVISNLTEIRDEVEEIFTEILEPHNLLPGKKSPSLFNISAGKCLSEYPINQSAISLLSLGNRINMSQLTPILLSPFIHAAEIEFSQRADLDFDLRQTQQTQISLEKLLAASQTKTPMLYQRLDQLRKLIVQRDDILSPSEWTIYFNKILSTLGWPGQRSLMSEEYQQAQRFNELLNEFSSIDWLTTRLSFTQALELLTQLAKKTQFQTKASEKEKIQVLGTLEASHQDFDAIWLMGMNADRWPAQVNLNPFLPIQLQKKLAMPHSSAEKELKFSRHILDQFQHHTKQLIVSYSTSENDRELLPSKLIEQYPAMQQSIDLDMHIEASINASSKLIDFVDETANPLVKNTTHHGGANILKEQSACPFRAFSLYRLNACSIEEPSIGLNSLARGTIVHRILELFWQQVRSRSALASMSEQELDALLTNIIEQALMKHIYKQGIQLKHGFLLSEKKRLHQLLERWLKTELNRDDFIVVAEEKALETEIEGLKLSLRIDRIDKIANNEYMLIDYKTGSNNHIYQWFSERPDEPQLPLYFTILEKNITAISYAEVAYPMMSFKGISQNESSCPGVKPLTTITRLKIDGKPIQWPQLQLYWQSNLAKVANDFVSGQAQVNPKNANTTCQFCNLYTFCRISELQQ